MLATVAAERAWLYIDAKNHPTKELLGRLANVLRTVEGKPQLAFAHAHDARIAVARAWQQSTSVTVVIDSASDPDYVLDALAEGGGTTPERRALLASRHYPTLQSSLIYEMPRLTNPEIFEFVTAVRGSSPDSGELDELSRRSLGNPLYLRYYAAGPPGVFEAQLQGYELREWRALPPRSKEVLSYLVLANEPLSLEGLRSLAAAASPEDILTELRRASHLLRTAGTFYDIFHDHLRDTLLDVIGAVPPQHRFYASRLADYFIAQGDTPTAFLILDRAGDPRATSLVNDAFFSAGIRGDISKAVLIGTRRLVGSGNSGR